MHIIYNHNVNEFPGSSYQKQLLFYYARGNTCYKSISSGRSSDRAHYIPDLQARSHNNLSTQETAETAAEIVLLRAMI